MKMPNKTIWGPAHAYTRPFIFDRWSGQVYETNEDLKKGLINAYNSWKNTRQLVEKSFNLTTVSGNSLTHQALQVSLRKAILIWQGWLMSCSDQ